ncbi:hypothetical protein LY28_01794 [Ruminiclostridium sufflavum DSM 19573]|uniref:Uncharacterized protein n=1 Tax=Ruminiclostridium sufflavum DSM 19573 TaxID=1121337 RepID=A0A318XMA8_9FIRM|nr:hypothetical protein LY28_01794 [Ruminiclostridium sufflavum DSM 19573]
MIILALCSLTIFLFVLFDLIPLYRKKKRKAFWIYIILIFFAYTSHVLYILDIKIPSPATPIKKLVIYIWGLQN